MSLIRIDPRYGKADVKLIYWTSAGGSSVGVLLGLLMILPAGTVGWFFLGLAHAIPIGVIMRRTLYPAKTTASIAILASLFPVWGLFVGMLGGWIAGPLVASVLWGVVLWLLTRSFFVFLSLFVLGLVTSAIGYLMVIFDLYPGWYGSEMVGASVVAWHIGMGFLLPAIFLNHPGKLARSLDGPVCSLCGYSLMGLPAEVVCPECGQSRRCVNCGYPLEGIAWNSVCPECGTPRYVTAALLEKS